MELIGSSAQALEWSGRDDIDLWGLLIYPFIYAAESINLQTLTSPSLRKDPF